MNKQELINELTKYVERYEGATDEYYQGKSSAYEVALKLAKKLGLDEPQKPVIPQLVAGWLEKSTDPFTKAEKIAYLIKSKDGDSYYFCDWFVRDGILTQEQGEELLAWATRQSYETLLSLYNGYEVEKEPLYYVRLPYEVWDEEAAELKPEYLYLHYEITSDETRMFPTKEPRKGFVAKLDELTIKSADERFWPFAVPVEEVAEG
ncbi:TPA: DUF1642 domain-containing protein [Enterococcus faecium]|uniref:DUF1642 domain-containing protein n=1 Tax=Enterococcus faecium TaxID=1352 RepID=UPI000F681D0F|nr:DUF1642 domain-containing protein [Enterococcus faecium]EKY7949624.1 DUF1642 domain-containing protein [Enterococcus faecium]EKZ0090194.1 DUF1642 domain-containing protein [Enterococcus faecium]EKZ0479350.1 DUF1642 domain-containing protein [Enterococcus faecium]EKZ0505790.1 DUF1642 domain-containing protein [Enterococcus faecium]EKZ0514626.1 DUF1642 domain-containing protein [Enterococcus faecium]